MGVTGEHPLCPECNEVLLYGSSLLKKGYKTHYCNCGYVSPVHSHPKNTFVLLPKKPGVKKPHYWQMGGRSAGL